MLKSNWLTMLSSDNYIWAVLALNYSLKKVKSKYSLVCACTENISDDIREILLKEDIIVEDIIAIPMQKKHPYLIDGEADNRIQNTLSKVALVNIKGYDKLFFIDADMYVLQNIDAMMEYPPYTLVGDFSFRDVCLFMLDFTKMNIPYEQYLEVVNQDTDTVTWGESDPEKRVVTDLVVFNTVWRNTAEKAYLSLYIPKEIIVNTFEMNNISANDLIYKYFVHYNLFPKPWDAGYEVDCLLKQGYVNLINKFKNKYSKN